MFTSKKAGWMLGLAAWLVIQGTAWAQAPGAPANINALFMKIFEGVDAFTAKANVQVLDSKGKEMARVPMQFSTLDQMVRLDINVQDIKSADIPPTAMEALKQVGMQRIVNIMRPDKKASYVIYPDAKSYLTMPYDAGGGTKGENLKVQKTPQGKEQLDGKIYEKYKVVIGDAQKPSMEATIWADPAMKGFPAQVRTSDRENTMVMRFQDVRLVKPAASQFQLPTGFTEYTSPQALMMGVASKMMGEALTGEAK